MYILQLRIKKNFKNTATGKFQATVVNMKPDKVCLQFINRVI